MSLLLARAGAGAPPAGPDVAPLAVPASPTPAARAPGVPFVLAHAAGWGALAATVGLPPFGPVQVLVLAWFALVPGDILRQACGVGVRTTAERFVLAAAGSLAIAILTLAGLDGVARAAAAGLVPLPPFSPLTPGPLLLASAAGLAPILLVAGARRAAPGPRIGPGAALLLAAVLVPAVVVRFGVDALQRGDGPLVSAVGLTAAGLILLAACGLPRAETLRAPALFAAILTIVWSWSERTGDLFGFDVHAELAVATRTAAAAAWQLVPGDAYAAMLSVTSLPVAATQLTGLSLLAWFKTVAPAALACYFVACYVVARRWAGPRASLAALVACAAVPPAVWQLPFITRQGLALCLFAGLMLLVLPGAQEAGGRGRRTALAVPMAAALPLTHYSTAYVTLAILVLGAALAALARLRRRGRHAPGTRIPLLLVVVLAGTIAGWNWGLTASTSGLERVVDEASSAPVQLRDHGSAWQTWLKGATTTQVGPQEYIEATRARAAARPWLVGYPQSVQEEFAVAPVAPVDHVGPGNAWAGPVGTALLLLRQGVNVALVGGVVLLAVSAGRRRPAGRPAPPGASPGDETSPGAPPEQASPVQPRVTLDLAAVAVAALLVTAAMRLSAGLSQAYNSERLLLQTSLLLAPGLALLVPALIRRLRFRILTGGALLAVAALTAFFVLDLTGLRVLLIGGDAGNVLRDGEYAQRYTRTVADRAASDWLGQRYGSGGLVFADFYGLLGPMSDPRFRVGLFPELSPATLDQRAWVLASTENVVGGRVRVTADGIRTTFTYPRAFLDTYKGRVYSNGYAEVYR